MFAQNRKIKKKNSVREEVLAGEECFAEVTIKIKVDDITQSSPMIIQKLFIV